MKQFSRINESKIDDYLQNLMDIGCDVTFHFDHLIHSGRIPDSCLIINIIYDDRLKVDGTIRHNGQGKVHGTEPYTEIINNHSYIDFDKKSLIYSELSNSISKIRGEFRNVIVSEHNFPSSGNIKIKVILIK